MKFWTRSLILTLPLQLALPKLCRNAEQLPLLHLSMMTKRSIVLTLPLLISSHMLRLLTLVDAYLLLHHAHLHPTPPDSVASRTRSRAGPQLERPKLYMPQITFDPLPVLNEGRD